MIAVIGFRFAEEQLLATKVTMSRLRGRAVVEREMDQAPIQRQARLVLAVGIGQQNRASREHRQL